MRGVGGGEGVGWRVAVGWFRPVAAGDLAHAGDRFAAIRTIAAMTHGTATDPTVDIRLEREVSNLEVDKDFMTLRSLSPTYRYLR